MKKVFTKLFSFFERKSYHPNQADIPVFDETITSEMSQTAETETTNTTGLSVVEEFKRAKSEIAEFEKAIKELAKQQIS